MTPSSVYVSTGVAAQRLGVSRTTIQRWARDGRIASYRLGPKNIRVDWREVEKTLVKMTTESRTPSRIDTRPDSDLKVIAALRDSPGASWTALLTATGMPRATFHRSVERLVRAGLVHNAGTRTRTRYILATAGQDSR